MSNKIKNKLDYNDVMDLTSEITFKLQDLKLIKGNNKNYNFEIDDEMRTIICKKLNIGEEQMSSEKQLILIILCAIIILGYQWIKEEKKKNDYRKKYRRSQGWE